MTIRKGRRLLWLLAAATLALMGVFGVLHYRSIAARYATWSAFREAETLAAGLDGPRAASAGQSFDLFGPTSEFDDALGDAIESLVESRDGAYFRDGLFDRAYWLRRLPVEGATEEASAAILVVAAFFSANEATFVGAGAEVEVEQAIMTEYRAWLDPVLLQPRGKEILANVLSADCTVMPRNSYQEWLLKLVAFRLLLVEDPLKFFDNGFVVDGDDAEVARWKRRLLGAVEERHWQAILRDSHHPREKVRVGSLLLLYHHPIRGVLAGEAKRALADPSEWVRLTAGGLLASRGDPAGAEHLRRGLQHPRSEVRFWSCHTLASLERGEDLPFFIRQARIEQDQLTRDMLESVLKRAGEKLEEQLQFLRDLVWPGES